MMTRLSRLMGFWLAVSALIFAHVAIAETVYQIEIIAFARESSDADSEENWNRRYTLRYPERYVNLQPADAGNGLFQTLSSDALQLNREAEVIAGRRNMRVLLHQAWRQTVDDPAHATAVIIGGGKSFGIHHELEGALTLSVEHFLRVDANLWLSRFTSNGVADAQPLPNPPGTIADVNTNSVAAQTFVLQEQRRLRSGELHYFDHPRLGLLVLVTPVAPPAQ